MAKPHAAAACVAVNVCPAIVAVVARAAPGFAMAVSFTVPLPVPDAPLDTLSHDVSLLAAVHVHQLLVVTVTVAVSPGDASAALAGEIVNAHDAACCDAVKVWPPIVTVALRAGPLFA